MIEASTTERSRIAMKRAHEERSLALKAAWHWLFPYKTSR